MSTFIALPAAFNMTGKVNTASIERYYPEETSAKVAGRFRIVIDLTSNRSIAAEFDSADERDRVFDKFDRFLTGRDKIPQYDSLDSDF